MEKYLRHNFLLCVIFLFVIPLLASSQNNDQRAVASGFSHANCNFELSPCTGYTRAHWIEITEKVIAGVLPYLDKETGMPNLAKTIEGSAFENVRDKNPKEEKKRALERIMMAVVIYNKATGKDQVPGYNGSITAPFIKAIIKGTDPDDPEFWGDPEPNDQVGSTFAIGAYLSPEVFFDPLSPKQKQNILNYLQKQAFNKTYDNNHYLFHMIPVALLEKNGVDGNREHLTQMFKRLMGWYRGDGWFIDGSNGGFDNYNLWGFQLFYQILDRFDSKWHNQFDRQIKQVSNQFFGTLPYLFGRDGGPIPWGRSLTYRFADISFIGWSVLNGTCTLSPGQARRIASGSLKYFWEHGCLSDNNLLNIGYWGKNESIAESYISPGDPYWATHGLSCLLIPEEDPFWTATEEPIPADGAGGKIAVSGAQLSIRVSPMDGEARLFPVGQPFTHARKMWQGGTKYDQYSYSSYIGFCTVGEGGFEIGAGRSGYSFDGLNWDYRERARSILVSNDHLIDQYTLKPDNQYEITTHTLIGNDGEIRVFWHNYPEPIFLYLGGYGILVQDAENLKSQDGVNNILMNSGEYYSIIQSHNSFVGKFSSQLLIPADGWNSTHLFGGEGAFPYWQSTKPVPPNEPLIFYVNGTRGRKPIVEPIEVIRQRSDLKIRFEGNWYAIHTPF